MTKVLPLGLALTLALAFTACSRSSANTQDQAIATTVQNKLASDPALQGANVTATATQGVVTLSGSVGGDAARTAAQNDAQVPGVTQVNNQIATVTPANPAAAAPSAGAAAAPAYSPASTPSAAPAPAMTAEAPVEVESGTRIAVRLDQALSSSGAAAGQTFDATLAAPVLVNGQVAIPQGAAVTGDITAADSAGHFKGQSRLVLRLQRVRYNGNSYSLSTDTSTHLTGSRSTRSAETIGGGAALGALIGAIAGHGKGAAIGAASGAGAGTAAEALTKPAEVNLPAETELRFTLTAPVQVVPASSMH